MSCNCGSCSQENLAIPKGPAGDNGVTNVYNTSSGQSIIHTELTDVATTAVTTEETSELVTLDLNALNILNKDGDEIHIDGFWTFAANANTKTVRVYIGSTVINTSGAFNNVRIYNKYIVKRISATSQKLFFKSELSSGAINALTVATFSENLNTGSLIIKWTAQNGTASANDIISNFRTIYKFKNV